MDNLLCFCFPPGHTIRNFLSLLLYSKCWLSAKPFFNPKQGLCGAQRNMQHLHNASSLLPSFCLILVGTKVWCVLIGISCNAAFHPYLSSSSEPFFKCCLGEPTLCLSWDLDLDLQQPQSHQFSSYFLCTSVYCQQEKLLIGLHTRQIVDADTLHQTSVHSFSVLKFPLSSIKFYPYIMEKASEVLFHCTSQNCFGDEDIFGIPTI